MNMAPSTVASTSSRSTSPASCTSTTASSSSAIALPEFMARQLGRDLDATETKMLRQISPQGIAKINRDALNGVNAAQTLKDLTTVFQGMQLRRESFETTLSSKAKEMLQLVGRVPTTDELALFANVQVKTIAAMIRERIETNGEIIDEIIEDLSMQYKYEQLAIDAKAFAESQPLPTRMVSLAPTVPPSAQNPLAPNMARVSPKQATVGLNPIQQWFLDEIDASTDKKTNPMIIIVDSAMRRRSGGASGTSATTKFAARAAAAAAFAAASFRLGITSSTANSASATTPEGAAACPTKKGLSVRFDLTPNMSSSSSLGSVSDTDSVSSNNANNNSNTSSPQSSPVPAPPATQPPTTSGSSKKLRLFNPLRSPPFRFGGRSPATVAPLA